jgi:hypothetical protein
MYSFDIDVLLFANTLASIEFLVALAKELEIGLGPCWWRQSGGLTLPVRF